MNKNAVGEHVLTAAKLKTINRDHFEKFKQMVNIHGSKWSSENKLSILADHWKSRREYLALLMRLYDGTNSPTFILLDIIETKGKKTEITEAEYFQILQVCDSKHRL